MKTIIISIICSVIGTVICTIVGKVFYDWQKYKQSEFSGLWYDEIIDKKGEVEKRDEYNIKHNKKTHTITGTIKRYYPEEQKHRHWTLNGVIYDRYIIISFWHIGPQKSNGCIYAKLVDDFIYEGFYLEEHNEGVIDKTPIRLLRKKREG